MKKRRQEKRKNTPPLCGLVSFLYLQWCCLLIHYYNDIPPEQSGVASWSWTLPCLIWSGALVPNCINFSCFQFGLSTCAALAIYITMNISCCGLFCAPAPVGLPVIHASLWISSHEAINTLDLAKSDIKSVVFLDSCFGAGGGNKTILHLLMQTQADPTKWQRLEEGWLPVCLCVRTLIAWRSPALVQPPPVKATNHAKQLHPSLYKSSTPRSSAHTFTLAVRQTHTWRRPLLMASCSRLMFKARGLAR